MYQFYRTALKGHCLLCFAAKWSVEKREKLRGEKQTSPSLDQEEDGDGDSDQETAPGGPADRHGKTKGGGDGGVVDRIQAPAPSLGLQTLSHGEREINLDAKTAN